MNSKPTPELTAEQWEDVLSRVESAYRPLQAFMELLDEAQFEQVRPRINLFTIGEIGQALVSYANDQLYQNRDLALSGQNKGTE